MSNTPFTRPDRVTLHQIDGETFQVFHFADGDQVAYRFIPHDDDPMTLVPMPVDDGKAEELRKLTE